jgi:hypothetical protein
MSDRSYAEQRALQERLAAEKAKHPSARKAHSDLADRYEKMARSDG